MARLPWLYICIVLVLLACEKTSIVPCTEPLSDQVIAGEVIDNGCGILQTLNQEVPTPERWDSSQLELDINLDGVMDFKFMATFSASPSHSYSGLKIRSINSNAFFGFTRLDYGICYLLNPSQIGYPSIDCRKSCSDYLPEEITAELDTVLRTGQFFDIEGVENGALIDNNRLWAQTYMTFATSRTQLGVRDCLGEIINSEYRWARDTTLYIPIKLLNDQGVPTFGWIKCQYDRQKNPVYESFIQTG